MNLAFYNILYINNTLCNVDNVKPINNMFSLTIMVEDISNYGQEVFISIQVSVAPENARSLNHVLQNYLILSLIPFCISNIHKINLFDFCNFSVFSKLQTIQLILMQNPTLNLSLALQNQ